MQSLKRRRTSQRPTLFNVFFITWLSKRNTPTWISEHVLYQFVSLKNDSPLNFRYNAFKYSVLVEGIWCPKNLSGDIKVGLSLEHIVSVVWKLASTSSSLFYFAFEFFVWFVISAVCPLCFDCSAVCVIRSLCSLCFYWRAVCVMRAVRSLYFHCSAVCNSLF